MLTKCKALLVAMALALLVAPAAFGALTQVGPINPTNGFPAWYMDANGVALELPVPPFGTPPPAVPPPPTMIFDAPVVGNAFSQTIGFGTEAFYWIVRARAEVGPIDAKGNGQFGRLTFLCGLEASFFAVPPALPVAVNGQQVVFSRLRLILTGNKVLPVGTYTLLHPYGSEILPVDATAVAKNRAIAFTRDTGALTPLNFTAVLPSGDIGPFLVAAVPPPVFPLAPLPFQTGWIGDGVTPGLIVGSPLGRNFIRLTGPAGVNLDGAGNNFIQISTFELISGHKAPTVIPAGLTIDRMTYSHSPTTFFLDIFATTATGSTVTAQVGATTVTLLEGIGVQAGHYAAHVPITALPTDPITGALAPIVVTATKLGAAPVTASLVPVDVVTLSQATFNPATSVLTVTATSSDTVTNPPLTVTTPALGPIVAGVPTNFLVVAPETVIVTSAAGGTAALTVTLTPVPAVVGPAPVPGPVPVGQNRRGRG